MTISQAKPFGIPTLISPYEKMAREYFDVEDAHFHQG
jgi:hypothetical protein